MKTKSKEQLNEDREQESPGQLIHFSEFQAHFSDKELLAVQTSQRQPSSMFLRLYKEP